MLGVHTLIAKSSLALIMILAANFALISAKLSLAEVAAQQQDTQVVRYANIWAVEVRGGAEEADALALKHGLINRGQVKADVLYHRDCDSAILFIFLLCRLEISNTTTCLWTGRL